MLILAQSRRESAEYNAFYSATLREIKLLTFLRNFFIPLFPHFFGGFIFSFYLCI